MSLNNSAMPIRFVMVFLLAVGIISFLGCGDGSEQDESDDSDDTGIVQPADETGIDEPIEDTATEEEEMVEREEEAADREEDSSDENGPDEEEEPEETEEGETTPEEDAHLVPPAEDAEGVEDVEEGEIAFVASVRGTGEAVELENGISVTVSDNLYIQCSIVNNLEEVFEIEFMSSQKLDALFRDTEGNLVYQWSQDRRFAQVINTLELSPGEVWSHELTVPTGDTGGGVAPGIYTIIVQLTGSPSFGATANEVEIVR